MSVEVNPDVFERVHRRGRDEEFEKMLMEGQVRDCWKVSDEIDDPVHHPSHYQLPGGIEVIDLIRDESYLRGNILKYIFRAPHKGNELQDLRKARKYLDWEIERLEGEL